MERLRVAQSLSCGGSGAVASLAVLLGPFPPRQVHFGNNSEIAVAAAIGAGAGRGNLLAKMKYYLFQLASFNFKAFNFA